MDSSWDRLWGVLPEELPYAVRVFVVAMLLFHALALLVWVLSTTREVAGGSSKGRRYKPAEDQD